MSGVGDKISIAEARARRADPVWQRRHQLADLRGIGLIAALVIIPPAASLLSRPLGAAISAALLLAAPVALWWQGPKVGLDRRTAVLVAVPILNLFVLVPAIWRAAHLDLQHWQGPLQPPWSDSIWLATAALGIACWLASAAAIALSLA